MPGMDMACAALAYTVVVGLGFELKFVSLSQPNLDTLRYARCRADQLGAGFHWDSGCPGPMMDTRHLLTFRVGRCKPHLNPI
jgi:hypothetical protein